MRRYDESGMLPFVSKSYVKKARILVVVAAFLSFLFSVGLWFLGDGGNGDKEAGLFVGLWVPSILALGLTILPPPGGPKS